MKKEHILIVEDECLVADDIKVCLKRLGYEVAGIAISGEEAIKKTEELKPDLVLMDIVLEGKINGIDAAAQIRSRFNIPVVYLTAYSDIITVERAKKTEPYGYILKPFEDRDLHSTIEMALYKHTMENMLRESEAFNFSLFQYNPIQTIAVDQEGKVKKVNMAKRKSGDRLPNFGDVMYKDYAGKYEIDMHAELMACIKKGKKKGFPELKYGDKFLSITIAPFPGGAIITSQDITERKKAEEILRQSQVQLRSLTAHLQSIREQERTLMAREMHDELGQVLTALKMDLSWLDRKIPKDQKSQVDKIKSMKKLIDSTLQTVKRISTELRPELLDDLGLSAAIEWQGEEFQNRTGIKSEVTMDPEEIILDQDCSTAIFRIFQETLTNVARHANATRVTVKLKIKANKLEMKVKDNGKGITEKQISGPKSFGLIGIRERVHFLGGEVNIRGVQDKGTTVTVRIPIPKKGKTG